MSKPKKLPLMKLSEFQPGQYGDCFAQLLEKSRGTTREGKPYYLCRFRDLHRTVAVMLWSDSALFAECEQHWLADQFFKLRGIYSEHHKYGPQLEAEQARLVEERDRAEGFSERDFVEWSRFDPEELFRELDRLAESEITDLPLRQLVQKILHDNAAALKLLPASSRHAYPFAGGWLEHTANVARTSVFLGKLYAEHFSPLQPPLNRGLIAAGAILHDIGRLESLDSGPPGQSPRSGIAGELLGHIHLGYGTILSAAREIPGMDPELLNLLLHIVVSHAYRPDSEPTRSPRIPEATIVKHAAELDRTLEMQFRLLKRDTSDGPFTEWDSVLGGALLKRRKV